MRRRFIFTAFFLSAEIAHAHDSDATLCAAATQSVEREFGLPSGLLTAISTIESGRHISSNTSRTAWPWTVNAAGKGYFFERKADAISAVQNFRQQGIQSIDVGCLQVNLHHHADAFETLDQAFDPLTNARYAAQFLKTLNTQQHGWFAATAAYHSLTPSLGPDYARHVYAVWNKREDSYRPPDFLPQVIMTNTGPQVIVPHVWVATSGGLHRFPVMRGSVLSVPVDAQKGRTLAAYRMVPTRLWRQ
ncbi:lytic transglycosylase domain-containing protein [Neokomagataea tanensis]|uniref:Lytic transglycosylase domain-containing protein n=1 Tax=Neokomagataea tanensis TaxID=661191 RepID=A0A4Y6VAE7_9PROT|nr:MULTISPECIES: transglycosylase SLT domain-containing protein [Neokomagataea]QDH25670.1 lytic transglycosylase domain-containing protein [Neokomagataea tanensis]